MSRETINQKVLDKLIKSKGFKLQTIRDGASRIKKKNHGLITSTAAAYVWAERNGVNVYRYLSDTDRKSLQHITTTPPEKERNVRGRRIRTKPTDVYYGQKHITNANQNAEIYPHVFILENTLRDLILNKFSNQVNWWENKKIVKEDIQKHAAYIKEQEKKHKWLGTRGNHPIYYVGLEHLYKIIEMNYNPHFKDIFELPKLKTWIDECIPIRNLLAHNIRTQQEERNNIKIRVKYICNLIEQALKQT